MDWIKQDKVLIVGLGLIGGSYARGLQRLGFTPGPRLGACLNYLLEQVLEETLPNTPEALAEEAMKFLTREGSL